MASSFYSSYSSLVTRPTPFIFLNINLHLMKGRHAVLYLFLSTGNYIVEALIKNYVKVTTYSITMLAYDSK